MKRVENFFTELHCLNIIVSPGSMSNDDTVAEVTKDEVVSSLRTHSEEEARGQDGIFETLQQGGSKQISPFIVPVHSPREAP